jgi:hypothetical protein
MDAFIHGYSNFSATIPVTEERIVAPIIEVPATFSRSVYDDTTRTTTNTAETIPSTPAYNMEAEVSDAGDVTARIEMMRAKRLADAQRIAQIEAEKQASLNNPIIVIPPSYVAPPLIVGGGSGGGSVGGRPQPLSGAKPLSGSTVIAKPSFLKKNFIPLLLVATAIYVFIKKPIK